jgi:4-hydroxy-2-oxoheptanedioate aldolase
MNGIELGVALKSGQRANGTLITSPSPHLPDSLCNSGLDFVFIDTEHIPIGDHDLSWMCKAYSGMNLVPLVRIPEPDPYRACKVLDAGAGGIIAPYVESVEQVCALRGAVKLRPLKGERLAHALNGTQPEKQLGRVFAQAKRRQAADHQRRKHSLGKARLALGDRVDDSEDIANAI